MNFGGIQNFIHQKLVWPPKHQEDLIKISFTVGFGTSQRFASIFATVPFLSYVCFQGSGVMPLTGQEVCVYSAPQSLAESVVSDCAAALEIGHLWNFRLPIVIQHLDLGHIPMFTGKKMLDSGSKMDQNMRIFVNGDVGFLFWLGAWEPFPFCWKKSMRTRSQ